MTRSIILGIAMSLSLATFAQQDKVMVVSLNNGNSEVLPLKDVKELTFMDAEAAPGSTAPDEVTRSMELYFNFDSKTAADQQNRNNGYQNGGTYIYDTPCGDGCALMLKQGQYVTIGNSPIEGRLNYTLSLWIKDYEAGTIIKVIEDDNTIKSGSLQLTENMRLRYCTGASGYSSTFYTFAADMSNFQSGQWVMLTIVTEEDGAYSKSSLYINGKRVDTGTSFHSSYTGGMSVQIGGGMSMKIDNVRMYSAALSEDEVDAIYTRESRSTRITVPTRTLDYDVTTSKLPLIITNNTPLLQPYTISDDLGLLKTTPSRGTLMPNAADTVSVEVYDRDDIDNFQRGTLTITAEGVRHGIPVNIDCGSNHQQIVPVVTRSLAALYTFDKGNANDDFIYENHGSVSGATFVDDTPNGSGKALQLRSTGTMSLAYAPFDGKANYSISFWIKDFGAGSILKTKKSQNETKNGTLAITENMRLRYCTGSSGYSSTFCTFTANMSALQTGRWTMITIVTEGTGSYSYSTLYINGRRADAAVSFHSSATGATSMEVGGGDPMKIDNLRFYTTVLTDDEVAAIYASESK